MKTFQALFLGCCLLSACAKVDTNTKELNFSRSKLSQLPDVSAYQSVEAIYADENKLRELPAAVFGLANLKHLDVSYNQFADLPADLSKLSNLEYLDISHNQFQTLPASVLELGNLSRLDLRHNQLSDLPDGLQKLQKLETVYLSGNKFSDANRQKYRKLLPKAKFVWSD